MADKWDLEDADSKVVELASPIPDPLLLRQVRSPGQSASLCHPAIGVEKLALTPTRSAVGAPEEAAGMTAAPSLP